MALPVFGIYGFMILWIMISHGDEFILELEMMPSIEISETDFQRLQKIAVPLIDTPRSIMTKLLDTYEKAHGAQSAGSVPRSQAGIGRYGFSNVPPLTHTKLMAAQFDTVAPSKTSWDALVQLALTRVIEEYQSAKELHRLSGANVIDGKKQDEGYKYLPPNDFSYQGVSAEDAAKIVVRCAKALGCSASFEFEWRNKDAAYKPGQRGIVEV